MAYRNRAGAGLGTGQASAKFGHRNTQAGESAERRFGRLAADSKLVGDYESLFSLRVPKVRGQKDYKGVDVDAVFVNGDEKHGYRIYLVDVKGWQGRKFYWSIFGYLPFKGVEPIIHKKGGERSSWSLSKSATLALNRYRDYFSGYNVRIKYLVAFTGVGKQGSVYPTSVSFFMWPGFIRSFLDRAAFKKIKGFLGKPVEMTDDDPVLTRLSNLQKRGGGRR